MVNIDVKSWTFVKPRSIHSSFTVFQIKLTHPLTNCNKNVLNITLISQFPYAVPITALVIGFISVNIILVSRLFIDKSRFYSGGNKM